MTALLNRQYLLAVGGKGIASSRPDAEGFHPTLRIAFKVVRSLTKETNNSEIAVFNLNEESRKSLDARPTVPVVLSAGYGTELSRIFSGDVSYVASQRQGVDWVTKLSLQDGANKYRSARINLSLGPGTTIGAALQRAASAMGVPVGNLSTHLTNARGGLETFSRGIVLSGSAQGQLDKLLKTAGYGWSIQDGQLQVLAPKETTNGFAVKLSPTTGLIGSPERGDKGITKAKALIQPGLLPGNKVVLESAVVNGAFRIEKSTFKGDSHDTDWYVEFEGKPV